MIGVFENRYPSALLTKTKNKRANQSAYIRPDERNDRYEERAKWIKQRFGKTASSRTSYQPARAEDRPNQFPSHSGISRLYRLLLAFEQRRWQIAHELWC